MELINNKKGYTNMALIVVIFVAFFIMIFAVITSYAFGTVDNSLSQITGQIGNNTFEEVYQDTLQLGIISMQTTVPNIVSTVVLLGMVIAMILVGWSVKKINQLWILLDIMLLIIAEILAFLIQSSFTNFITSNEAFVAIARDTLPLGAKYLMNLTTIIPTVGILIMLTTYFISREKEESPFTA